MPNPYETLGVSRTADADEIRRAYKKLARKYHPDRNPSPAAEKRFKEINGAYDIIGDEAKRKLYDEFGEASTRPGFNPQAARSYGGGFGGSARGGFGGFGGGQVNMDDILESFLGGGRAVGRDLRMDLEIEALLAITGGETPVRVQRPGGAETLRVRIPAGAEDGATLRLAGQGAPPRGGGPCGDLMVRLRVKPHPKLRRNGSHLEMDVPVTVLEAIEGAHIMVPTPTGRLRVRIPPGSGNGTRLRIRGRGVQGKPPGDLYLVIRPTVPREVPEELVHAARALEAAYVGDVRSDLVL